ncbi:uncharacterized RING finger protein C548.05c-like [Ostrinia furnacalis]|uniref:uncharacterized RING finger protein C548.05c-like n=1 Tax=Ostrinia furnacalis TaxID=93504 RepID=UPI001038C72E|nr:uncharacterized RING finger protein C548.05c-like [Ostrinia furnacalis]
MTSDAVIDLTRSFVSFATDQDQFKTNNVVVIDLLDTDDERNINSVQEKISNKKHRQQHIEKTGSGGSSYKEKRSSPKTQSYDWGECPICWDKMGSNPLASTKCGHVYCLKCLERSLKVEKRCPTCRRGLKGNSAYHPLYLNI